MKSLVKEYRPKDRLSVVEAETEQRKVKLRANENPEHYFKRLGVVKSKWKKSKIFTEEDMIAHTMLTTPEIYLDTLTQTLTIFGDKVTMDDLKKALKLNWRLRHKDDEIDDVSDIEKDGEVALSLNDVIVCDKCGKSGHLSKYCWTKLSKEDLNGGKFRGNNKDNGRFNGGRGNLCGRGNDLGQGFKGKCNICVKVGHKEKNCFEKEENASKRSRGWKSTMAEAGGSSIEICLSCIDNDTTINDDDLDTHIIDIGSSDDNSACEVILSSVDDAVDLFYFDADETQCPLKITIQIAMKIKATRLM